MQNSIMAKKAEVKQRKKLHAWLQKEGKQEYVRGQQQIDGL